MEPWVEAAIRLEPQIGDSSAGMIQLREPHDAATESDHLEDDAQ